MDKRRRVLRVGWCRAVAVGVALTVLRVPSPDLLWAQGWSLETNITETVEVDNNVRLQPNNSDWVFGSLTTPRLTLSSGTSTLDLAIDAGAEFVEYDGPGDDGTLDSIDPDVETEMAWRFLRTTVAALVSYSRQSVRSSEIEDTGNTGGDATRVSLVANPSVTFSATLRDQLALTGSISITDFEDDAPGSNRTGNSSYGTTLRWTRTFRRNESGSASLGVSRFDADAVGGQQSLTFSADVGYSRQFSPRLSIDSSLGADLVESESGLGAARLNDSSLSFSTDSSVDYNLSRTQLSLSFSQSIEPSARGAVEQRSSVRVRLGYDVHSTLALRLTGSYAAQAGSISFIPLSDTRRELINVEPSLDWELFPDLVLNAGYRLRHSDSQDTRTSATSSAVYLRVTYNAPIL